MKSDADSDMDRIDVATARKMLADLLRRANRGEQIAITRYGREMALLVPFEKKEEKPDRPEPLDWDY